MLKNEKGSAMVLAVIALAVISIFTGVFIFLGSSNIMHVNKEENKSKAYYVAKTGAESVLNAAKSSADIVATLDKFKDEGKSTGDFDGEKFEIEVTKPEPLKSIYHIKSTAKINETEDGTTAIIEIDEGIVHPYFDGTIFGGGEKTTLKDLDELQGKNMKVYTKYYAEDKPTAVEILSPDAIKQVIIDITNEMPNRKTGDIKSVDGKDGKKYEIKVEETFGDVPLKERDDDHNHPDDYIKTLKIYELIENKREFRLEIEYGYDLEKKEENKFEQQKDQTDKYFNEPFKSETLDKKGMEITESLNYGVGNADDWTIDATSNVQQEPLVVRIGILKLQQNKNLTIRTSKNKDIVMIMKEFKPEGHNEINVVGDGKLSILISDVMQFQSYSHIKVDKEANLDIFMRAGASQFELNDKSSIVSASLYALGGKGKKETQVDIDDSCIFRGQIMSKTYDINKSVEIGSYSEDELKDKHTIEPRVYIEWKK